MEISSPPGITSLTGDVTGTGPGATATTISNNAVTTVKIANAAVDLTTKVTGILPIANGGTGVNTLADFTDSSAGADGITVTGGIGAVVVATSISQQVADATHNGYLSSTDWNTFNSAAGGGISALTGDVTATGPGSAAATLATVNGNVGSFGSSTSIPNFTVNAKGLITAAGGNVVIAPAGTLTGTTLNATVVTSSLTSVGTITTGVWNGTAINETHGGTNQTSYTTGDILYASAANTLSKLPIGSATNVLTVVAGLPAWAAATTGITTIGTIDTAGPSANGLTITGANLFAQSASATFPGMVNLTTQSFAGNKTFTGTIVASNLSGTNTGDVTLTAVGATPNANAATLTGQALNLEYFDSTNPGVVTASGGGTTNFLRADNTWVTPTASTPAFSGQKVYLNTTKTNFTPASILKLDTLESTAGSDVSYDITTGQITLNTAGYYQFILHVRVQGITGTIVGFESLSLQIANLSGTTDQPNIGSDKSFTGTIGTNSPNNASLEGVTTMLSTAGAVVYATINDSGVSITNIDVANGRNTTYMTIQFLGS